MSRSSRIFGLVAFILLGMEACNPIYRAGIPVQPTFRERGDAEIHGGVETGSAYVGGSYSIANNFYLSGGGLGWVSQNGQTYFGELGAGVYSATERSGIGLNFFGGYGISEAYNSSWIALESPNWGDNDIDFYGQYARLNVQPYIYYYTNYFDFTAGIQNSFVQWQSPDIALGQETGIDLFLQPHTSIRFGAPNMKVSLEMGMQVPLVRSFQHANMTFHLGLGMTLNYGKRIKDFINSKEDSKQ